MDTAPPTTTSAASSSPFLGSGSSFLILSVSIVGILAISLLLLAYYLFLTRCHHCSGGLLFFFFFCRPAAALAALDLDDDVRVRQPHNHHIVRSRGLEEAAIRRIPTFRYRRSRSRSHLLTTTALSSEAKPASSSDSECAVCLADFRDGERLRMLPPCLHAFHIDCIDAWLQATANCPLCRAAVVSGSGSAYANHLLHVQLPLSRATHHHHVAIDIIPSGSAAEEAEAAQPAVAAHAPPSEQSETQTQTTTAFVQFQPMRRSLSMDSSTDKRFYLALQRALQQQHKHKHNSSGDEPDGGKGESSSNAADDDGGQQRSSRRLRRSFFSFSLQSRASPSAVLPLSSELLKSLK